MQQKTINYFNLDDIPLCDDSISEIAEKFDPNHGAAEIDIALVKVSRIVKVITDSEDLEYLLGQIKSFGNFWVKLS
jgi:hypothetical protein